MVGIRRAGGLKHSTSLDSAKRRDYEPGEAIFGAAKIGSGISEAAHFCYNAGDGSRDSEWVD